MNGVSPVATRTCWVQIAPDADTNADAKADTVHRGRNEFVFRRGSYLVSLLRRRLGQS